MHAHAHTHARTHTPAYTNTHADTHTRANARAHTESLNNFETVVPDLETRSDMSAAYWMTSPGMGTFAPPEPLATGAKPVLDHFTGMPV